MKSAQFRSFLSLAIPVPKEMTSCVVLHENRMSQGVRRSWNVIFRVQPIKD